MQDNANAKPGVDLIRGLLPGRPLHDALLRTGLTADLLHYQHPPAGVRHQGIGVHTFVINLDGRAVLRDRFRGEQWQGWVEAGCFSFTPAEQLMERSWKGRPEVVLAFLSPDVIENVASQIDVNPGKIELLSQIAVRDPTMETLGRMLVAELKLDDVGSRLMIESAVVALSVHTLRRYSTLATGTNVLRPQLSVGRFNRVLDYMTANLDQPIGLKEVSAVCGLSPTHFGRAFKDVTGKSPHAFFIELRLEEAKRLLETTTISITEIAGQCGFEQAQYFATVFRQKVGLTPSAWRLERRGARS